MFEVLNVHDRFFPVEATAVARLLNGLGSPHDLLWPQEKWPPMRFERTLGPGAVGGHGPVRYEVSSLKPEEVRFTFTQPHLWRGLHYLRVEQRDEGAVLRHVIEARLTCQGWFVWHLAVRWLHDALLEDALDKAEHALTGTIAQPAHWSLWVRTLRWLLFPRRTGLG